MIISMMITTIIPIGNQSVFFSDSAERRKKTLRGSLLAGAKETTWLLLGSVWLCTIFCQRWYHQPSATCLCPPPSYHVHLQMSNSLFSTYQKYSNIKHHIQYAHAVHMFKASIPLYHPVSPVYCYRLNVTLPSKSECWNLNAQYDSIKRQGFGEVIRSWGWGTQEWDQCPIKEDLERSLTPSTLWGQHEKSKTCKRALTQPCWPLILGLQPLELWEMKFCCL